jgi:hypothetical protein
MVCRGETVTNTHGSGSSFSGDAFSYGEQGSAAQCSMPKTDAEQAAAERNAATAGEAMADARKTNITWAIGGAAAIALVCVLTTNHCSAPK